MAGFEKDHIHRGDDGDIAGNDEKDIGKQVRNILFNFRYTIFYEIVESCIKKNVYISCTMRVKYLIKFW